MEQGTSAIPTRSRLSGTVRPEDPLQQPHYVQACLLSGRSPTSPNVAFVVESGHLATRSEGIPPGALRRIHHTKAGAWGVIRVLEGRLRYQVLGPSSEVILEPGRAGLIFPEQPHLVEPLGRVPMQVEFYDHLPEL